MKKGVTQRILPRTGTKTSSRTQSLGSPLSGPYILTPSPSRLLPRRITNSELDSNHLLDICDGNEDWLLAETVTNQDERIQGIRYITVDLISKLTKQDNLAFVRSLNLAITKSGEKKFKFIENLEKCERLQVLNISHNVIEKIEKLEKLNKLRELHLCNNRISKIEGLEHMANLQLLNLSSNNIEHVPMWLPKKLRSLRTLNLQQNKISSLQDVSRLKPLKNLIELSVAENPVSNLPHYRLFLVFHLRSLETLDEQPISQEERDQAHQRFHMEEIERLEQDLEFCMAEMDRLQREKAAAVEELERQERLLELQHLKSLQDQQYQTQQKQELDTKTELQLSRALAPPCPSILIAFLKPLQLPTPLLDAICQLKQKTLELTRACQKQYELEQELAFQKIDAKFEPYPYYPDHELEASSSPGESAYIGKAQHKRNLVVLDGTQIHQGASAVHTERDNPRQDLCTASFLDWSLEHNKAEEHLQQLHREIEEAEQQVLRAGEELRLFEDTLSQKKLLEAEKEQLRQQLHRRIQHVKQLRDEAEALEGQLDRQRGEISRAQGELDQLQSLLDTHNPKDAQHTHIKGQFSSKSQLLDTMSRKHRELEVRLDDLLFRIAKETADIKDLEQQLTDGQIAANEALKRDLEGIISGLQDYLSGVKEQARHSQADCHHLQREKEALQRRLEESQEHHRLLERIASTAEAAHGEARMELKGQQQQLEQLRRENAELRGMHGQISVYEAELESQLKERTTEAGRLKEELGQLRMLSQLEHTFLRTELEKERQAKDNAQAQLTAEREQEKQGLLEKLSALQDVKASLEERVGALQSSLEEVRGTLLCPLEVQRRLEEMTRTVASGKPGHIRARDERDVVGRCLERLHQEVLGLVSAAQTDREQAQLRQARLGRELASLREQHTAACQTAAKGKEAERLAEEEIQRLRKELLETHKLHKQISQWLQDADEVRERLLTELEEQDKQMELGSLSLQQLRSLDMELRELKRSFTTEDNMASKQLLTAKEQLQSLYTTVEKISQERAQDTDELERSRVLMDQITQNLIKAEAEIHLLQRLLKDQMDLIDCNGLVSDNSIQRQELDHLKQSLTKQEAQTKGLREQLFLARKENSGNLEELMRDVGALRENLVQQNQVLLSLRDPHRTRDHWCYVPAATKAPNFGSQGTQDSGLGLQYPLSPDRGRCSSIRHQVHRDRAHPLGGGYWIYSPPFHTNSHTARGEGRDSGDVADCSSSGSGGHFSPPPGSVIYTTLPDGSPLPPGSVIYAPTAAGLEGSPGKVVYGPPPQGAQLVYGPCPCSLSGAWLGVYPPAGVLHCNMPGHQNMERELGRLERQVEDQQGEGEEDGNAHVEKDVLRLLEQRTQLKLELRKLHKSLRQLYHRLREVQEGRGGSEVLGEVLEKSLQHQGALLDEVECVEKTLLRRRAELRKADRLLLEAQSSLKDIKNKTKDALQQHTEAQHRLEDTQRELEELEVCARDSATLLVEAQQHLRDHQEELQELRRCNEKQTETLQRVEEVVAARDREFQEVNKKVAVQHEELSLLDKKLGQWRNEEQALQVRRKEQQLNLEEALRQGEEAKKLVRKGELEVQLAERRASVAALKQQEEKEEEVLLNIRSHIHQNKAEQKIVLETLQLENEELQDMKLHHNQVRDLLGRCQENVLQVHAELQGLQQEAACQRSEGERQRRLLEQEHTKLEELKTETRKVREQAEEAAREKSRLEEQCQNLEARRTHADQCLEAAEEGVRRAEVELKRLQAELGQLKQEQRLAVTHRETMDHEEAATQQQIDQQTELLSRLKEQVEERRHQLEMLEEDMQMLVRDRDSEEQEARKQLEEDERRAEQFKARLEELHADLAERQAQLQCVQGLQRQASEKETSQRLQTLKTQCQAEESTLAQHTLRLEQVTAADMETSRLHRENEQCALMQERMAQLGQELCERDTRLKKRAEELRTLQQELQEERSAQGRLQVQSREHAHRDKLYEAEQEPVRLQRELLIAEQAAQEYHQKAKGLQKELNTVSKELEGLKDALRSREEGERRLREIREAMRDLKTDIKAELSLIRDPDPNSSDANDHKENYLRYSAPSVPRPAYNPTDEQWRVEGLRFRLRQQENQLKAQLRRRMRSQEEFLSHRWQQTEGSLQGLRRQVDKLDQLLGNSLLPALPNQPPLKKAMCEQRDKISVQ
ncbi:centriolin isoform X2 [Esox lucius]|uniref:centriolin isoform X2 n=1 Tax=Esox lucius TaxID=8010 RepID=UPI0014774734|nr:centriolin isoform X2 [Esox lucius]